jgi:hypothetical protein
VLMKDPKPSFHDIDTGAGLTGDAQGAGR